MRPRLLQVLSATLLATSTNATWSADTAAKLHFDIARFEVTGNTLLGQDAVDAALSPFKGKQRDYGDIQRAREALALRYHALGHKLVNVELPEQEISSGVVRFNIVQTKIGRIVASGNSVFDAANIRRSVPALREGESPNLNEVSAGIRLANDNPAKKITIRLQSGAREGEADARLDVIDERPWKAGLNLDNTGTSATGKTHASLLLQHANLFGRDHVASIQYTTTIEKPSQVAVLGAGYHIPLYALGDSIDLYGSHSNVNSGTVAAGLVNLAVSGKGSMVGARYNQALSWSARSASTLQYGMDYKVFENVVLFSGQNLGNDVTVHPLSIAYIGKLTLTDGEANMSMTLAHNISGGAHGSSKDIALARSGAKADYTVLRFAGAVSRTLAQDWQLRLLANGQYAADALVPGEQFGAGGAASVRGFDERAIASDAGLLVNLELFTPNLCGTRSGWQCRLLAFYDDAHLRRKQALPGEFRSTTISSAGIGARWMVGANVSVQIDYGHVLQAGASAGADKNKLHFRAGLSY